MAQAFKWTDDGAMVPLRPKLADAEFVVGKTYILDAVQERSLNSHNHYFAALGQAFKNLPEDQADRFANVEALRKYALVMTGWRDERTVVAESKAAAQRLASFVKPMDEHAVITVRECVVRVWTAKSQSMKAMGKAEFQKSKDDVLGFVAAMIAVSPEMLRDNAGKAA